MNIDSNGLIRWNPTDADVGEHPIVIVAEDPEGAFAVQEYTVVVEAAADEDGNANRNQAPLITSTPLFIADVDEPYSYAVQATDPEGNALQFEFSASTTTPDGLSIASDTGELTWTPTASQIGEHAVAILVRDDSGAVASQAFTIDVRENLPPEILSSPTTSITAGSTYRYSVRATDPESGELTYCLLYTSPSPRDLSTSRMPSSA